MTRKHLFIAILILLGSVTALLLFRRANSPTRENTPEENTPGGVRQHQLSAEQKLRLHPLASEEKLALAKQTSVSTWEEWLDVRTEIMLAELIVTGWAHVDTPEEVAACRQRIRQGTPENPMSGQIGTLKLFKAAQMPPPKYPIHPPPEAWAKVFEYQRNYHGPQTPEALMAEFDEAFMETNPESSDWDAHYPKAAWLKRLLDKGAHFDRSSDYGYYLELRRDLIRLKEQPGKWRGGGWGIPPTTNFEAYEDGYIDRKIWENDIVNQVRAEHPNETQITTFFPSSHPEKYLPVVGRMTYVRRRPDSSGMYTMGTRLTQEQRDNLLYKGIEPEDIEIVYIDNDYNVLTEKPKPFDQEEWDRKHTYDITPHGLRAYDGTILSPERYEEVFRRPMDDDLRHRYERYVEGSPAVDDSEGARAARYAAKAEFEKFQQGMRQLEQFATMSDAEIEQELERQFRQQFLPELPSEQSTPEHLSEALGTLHKYGFEDGLGRVKQNHPALAENLERLFRQQSNRRSQEPRRRSSSSRAQPSPENE